MFIGFGAVVNCAGIVAGGLAGMLFRSQISHALQENLIRAMGLVCLFLGIFCAMAVVGGIQDGMSGDTTTLVTKAVIDFVVTAAFAASLGRGCLFAAIPVVVIQESVTVFARFLAPVMTEAAISNLSLVSSMMIFCIGVNVIWDERFKVADMLPALVVAAAWAAF